MNAYAHETACDERHTLRQVCNARAAARLDEYRHGHDTYLRPTAPMLGSTTTSVMTSNASLAASSDAGRVGASTIAAAATSAVASEPAPQLVSEREPTSARAVADGPVEPIDVSHIPRAPLVLLAAIVLVCLLVLLRVLFGRRS